MKTNSRRSRVLAVLFSCSVCAGVSGFMATASYAETTSNGIFKNMNSVRSANSVSETSNDSETTLPTVTPAVESSVSSPTSAVTDEIPALPEAEVAETDAPEAPIFSDSKEETTVSDGPLPGGLFSTGSDDDKPSKSSGFDIGTIITAIPIQDILQKNPQIIKFIEKNPQVLEIILENPQILEFMLKNVKSLPF